MGFAAPIALLWLVVAGAPIAIHLIKRRDLKTLQLPTLALLREAQASSRKRFQIADLLLLCLRVLALLLLFGCLAQPYSHTTLAAGSGQALALALVLDDSASMQAARGSGSVLDDAKAAAINAIDELPAGSEVVVVLAGAPPALLCPRTTDLAEARRRVLGVRPSGTGTDLHGAIDVARQELARASLGDTRLLLYSDFRAGTVDEPLPLPRGVLTEVVRMDPDAGPNFAIHDVVSTPAPGDPTLQLVQVGIARSPEDAPETRVPHQDTAPTRVTIRIADESGEPLGEAEATLDGAAGVARVGIPSDALQGSYSHVSLIAEGDALPADNQRTLRLAGPSQARVWLINGSPHSSLHLDELTFLRAALETASQSGALALSVSIVDADAVESAALADVDVVILANVSAPSSRQGARLRQFVERGGGLLVTAGDSLRPRAYAAALGDCMPGRLEPATEAPQGPVVGQSPFLSIPEPRLRRRLPLSDLRLNAQPLMRFGDGSPLLAGVGSGDGRCAVLTSSIDLGWGDLPLAPEFVALVQESVRWLLGSRRPTVAPQAGQPVTLAHPDGARVEVETPSGDTLAVDADGVFRQTREAGTYTVLINGLPSTRASFVVSPESGESDLRPAPPLTEEISAQRAEHTTSRRRSWVPWMLLLAALALIAEGVLRSTHPRGQQR